MRSLLCFGFLLGMAAPLRAQDTLPSVDAVEWAPFRAHCLALLSALDEAKTPLSNAQAVRDRLDAAPVDPVAAVTAVRQLLDAHCLIAVHINPESRVKAVRGPASSELVRGRERIILVRVHNEGGVTSVLAVSGLGVRAPGQRVADVWLEAAPLTAAPLAKQLSGGRLEYVPVRLTALEAGKREATLRFDVGQGTQDLGFRAEVPLLFTVREP